MQQGHTSPLTAFDLHRPLFAVAPRRRIHLEASSVLTTTAGNAATLKRLSNKFTHAVNQLALGRG